MKKEISEEKKNKLAVIWAIICIDMVSDHRTVGYNTACLHGSRSFAVRTYHCLPVSEGSQEWCVQCGG